MWLLIVNFRSKGSRLQGALGLTPSKTPGRFFRRYYPDEADLYLEHLNRCKKAGLHGIGKPVQPTPAEQDEIISRASRFHHAARSAVIQFDVAKARLKKKAAPTDAEKRRAERQRLAAIDAHVQTVLARVRGQPC